MAYENNHYVPRLILRKFDIRKFDKRKFDKEKINLYNIKTKEYLHDNILKESFSENNLYSRELEEIKLGKGLESSFGDLLANKILNTKGQVVLNKKEITLIKKFLLIAQERVPSSPDWNKKIHTQEERWLKLGYRETKIENETDKEYWERTMRVIIESDSLSLEDILKHPDVTYASCIWACQYNACYLTFWDSSQSKEDFIVTDIGMTCEHEVCKVMKECNYEEMIKQGYLTCNFFNSKNKSKQSALWKLLNFCKYVEANFYMFSISKNLMIGLVNPFYRLFSEEDRKDHGLKEPDVCPTKLSKKALMINKRRKKEETNDIEYVYDIKQLSKKEVIYINCLMLDRIDEWLGFADPSKIIKSLHVYMNIRKTLNDFSKLKEHLENQGYEFINKKEIQEFADKFSKNELTEREVYYIQYLKELTKDIELPVGF